MRRFLSPALTNHARDDFHARKMKFGESGGRSEPRDGEWRSVFGDPAAVGDQSADCEDVEREDAQCAGIIDSCVIALPTKTDHTGPT